MHFNDCSKIIPDSKTQATLVYLSHQCGTDAAVGRICGCFKASFEKKKNLNDSNKFLPLLSIFNIVGL